MLEAKTSGKNGFGQPKYFVVTSADQQRKVLYTFWYRDNCDVTITSVKKQNSELIRIAIGQFCSLPRTIAADHVELNLLSARFEGEIKNRFGRLLLMTSLFPKARFPQQIITARSAAIDF